MHFTDGIASWSLPEWELSTCRSYAGQTVSGRTHSWGPRWWQVGLEQSDNTTPPSGPSRNSLGTSLCATQRGDGLKCARRAPSDAQ